MKFFNVVMLRNSSGNARIQKRTKSTILLFTIEETFDIIKRAHISTGHGGRDRMVKSLFPKYANITTWAIETFKSFCLECQRKKKRLMATGVVVQPIITSEFNSRGHVDLIDMQSMEANKSKWILVYQDHLTKFCVLRALTSKCASEVAYQLVDIFLLIGAPMILQSDNGAEFTSSIIEELKIIWPDLKIIHGKPRHPQSQGSVERANRDIKDMLSAWLGDNNTRDWTVGIKFVQFHKNSAFHAGIQRSPYEAMFGTEVRNGLVSSSLPSEVVERLQSEDDLLSIQSSVNSEPLEDVTSDLEVPASDTEELTPTDAVEAPSLTPVHPEQQPLETTCSSTPHEPPVLSPQVVNIQERQAHILHHRVAAKCCQSNQADRMTKRRRLALVPADIGNTVTIPIPSVDRGRGDPRNLMGKIVEKDQERELYKIAVRAGVRLVNKVIEVIEK